MRNYVLNDIEYDNIPLKVIESSELQECDREKLQKSIEKNRELINRMRKNEKYKELISAL